MSVITHRFIETNGIRMHIAEQGEGPLVVLLHGFPESWYSWRHQLPALAEAGYHCVAPDQRGYGQTDRPDEVDQYTLLHLVGDVVGLLDALGEETAVVAGHDWGAPVAWHTALMRPDRVRGVIGLAVPYTRRGRGRPIAGQRSPLGERFYHVYFQQPGIAEADLQADVRTSIRKILYSASGDAPPGTGWPVIVPEGQKLLDSAVDPVRLPAWLTEADIDFYTAEFERTGFAGGLNWYRNIDRNWELLAPWHGAKVTPPALYIVGDRDLVLAFPRMKELIAGPQPLVPNLGKTVVLPGCGHWTQQERPPEVNAAIIEFLEGVAGAAPVSSARS